MSEQRAAPVTVQVGNLFKTVWTLAADRRGTQLGYLALLVCAQSVWLCQPLVIGDMLNTVQQGGPGVWQHLWPRLVLLFGIELGFWTFHFPARVLERQLAFHIRVKFREQMVRSVCELPVKWHRSHHSGETIDQVSRAAVALRDFAASSFELLYMVMKLLGPVILLVALAPLASLAALGTSLVAVGTIYAFDRVLMRHYRDLNRQENSVAAAVQDYVTNIMTVITLRLEASVVGEVVRRSKRPYAIARSNYRMNEAKWFLVSLIVAAMAASVVAGYAYFTLAAGAVLMAGSYFQLFEYLRRVGDAFYNVAALWSRTVQHAADVYGTLHIAQAHTELVRASASNALPRGWRRLEISKLDFTYEDEKQRAHHLRDVALTLERGRSIALVGESGSGKSTLLGVLRGLHQAQANVRVDGVEVPHGLAVLSHAATLFPQEPEIFGDTVRFNVAFGVEADDQRVLEALDRACFSPVLARLPRGLDTNVAEKGVNLSGGERQRLALARGLFFSGDSELLLLDEATSSVDALNEQAIYRTLRAAAEGKCLVATIHKLHLLPFFDVVYFLHDGRVVDHGTVDELLARNAAFRRLHEAAHAVREAVAEVTG